MNVKKIQDAVNKVFGQISQVSVTEVKDLVRKTPDKWGKLLLAGGFFDSASIHLSDEELLNRFPELTLDEIDFADSFQENQILKKEQFSFFHYLGEMDVMSGSGSFNTSKVEYSYNPMYGHIVSLDGEESGEEPSVKMMIEDCEWVKAA